MSDVWVIENPALHSPAVDPLLTHRDEAWRFDLLDTSDRFVRTLTGVQEGGSLEFSVHQTIRSTGSLPVSGPDVLDVDWDAHRVAVWYSLNGGAAWEPLGVYVPTTPEVSYSSGVPYATIDLYDKLQVPAGAKTADWYAVDAGANPVTAALTVLALSGTQRVAAVPTAETLSVAMTWEPGTTNLQIINDLLAAANYFSLWVDASGTYRADPYVRPQDRGVAYTLRSGVWAIHSDQIVRRFDTFDVPNRVRLISATDGEEPALVSAPATDESVGNPFSYVVRGRWVDAVETVEATSQAVLDARAARRLVELQSPGAALTVRYAPLPLSLVALNSVLHLSDGPAGLDVRGVVQAFTVPLTTGGLTEAKIVEVRS